MKKIILTLSIVILMTINGFAQYKPFQFGLNVSPGVNITSTKWEGIVDTENRVSLNWGFMGNFYFVENYGLSTGFNIINQKGGYDYLHNTDTISSALHCDIKVQYLEIPLGFAMRTEKLGDFRIFSDISYGLGICINSNDFEYKDDLRKIRHGLILKLGAEYEVYKSSCLTFALKYNNDFGNFYKKENSLQHNIKLNSLCLEIGFVF